MLAGTGTKYREIDIRNQVLAIGLRKAMGILGLHNFSGADLGGKFVGVSKNTWVQSFLSIDDDDKIIDCFASFGLHDISHMQLNDMSLPDQFLEIERFVCLTYSSNGSKELAHLR